VGISTLREVMDEIASLIRAAANTGDIDVQVEPRLVGNPTTPCIDIYPGQDPAFDEPTEGFVDAQGGFRFTVRARVETNDSDANQDFLVDLMDDQTDVSIVNALLDDPTLNGHASSVHLEGVNGFALMPAPSGEPFLGCLWRFLVLRAES
jgi:hypothetical protein